MNGGTQAAIKIGMMMVTSKMMGTNRIMMPTKTNPEILIKAHTMALLPVNHTSVNWMMGVRGRTRQRQLARTARRPRSRLSLKSKLLQILLLIILSIQNTFRTRRGRQSKPQVTEDNEPEVLDDEEVVELMRVDEEDAEVVKVIEKKKKNDNNK